MSQPSPSRPSSVPRERTGSPCVLVVDDDEAFLRFARTCLSRTGFSPLEARSGESALELVQARKPELILLDLCLGRGLSGESVLASLKSSADTRHIPVIAVSGSLEDPEDHARLLAAGADEFVTKSEIAEAPAPGSPFIRRIKARLLAARRMEPGAAQPSAAPEPAKPEPAHGPGTVHTVLVIDDQRLVAEKLKSLFLGLPYRFLWAPTAGQGIQLTASELPDLVIVDLHLPDMPGQSVCGRIRSREKDFPWDIPILVLTADGRASQHAVCKDLDADEFLVKMAPQEVQVATIKSLIRRRRFGQDPRGIARTGAVSFDMAAQELKIAGEPSVSLTPTENALVAYLMAASGKPVEHGMLCKKVLGHWPSADSDLLRKHISNLRRKMRAHERLIVSVSGQGYRFDVDCAKTIRPA